jgi:hypothetical protein
MAKQPQPAKPKPAAVSESTEAIELAAKADTTAAQTAQTGQTLSVPENKGADKETAGATASSVDPQVTAEPKDGVKLPAAVSESTEAIELAAKAQNLAQALQSDQGPMISVVGPKAGRWRIGRRFGPDPVYIAVDDLSEAEALALRGDPKLIVGVAEQPS